MPLSVHPQATDWESIRTIGRKWFGKGTTCRQPDSVANLQEWQDAPKP